MYIEINEKDLKELLGALRYIAERQGETIDGPMVEYLKGVVGTVDGHLHNERFGEPGGKASGVAMQIDAVLPFLQGEGKEGDE
jgi:hypothetical protein